MILQVFWPLRLRETCCVRSRKGPYVRGSGKKNNTPLLILRPQISPCWLTRQSRVVMMIGLSTKSWTAVCSYKRPRRLFKAIPTVSNNWYHGTTLWERGIKTCMHSFGVCSLLRDSVNKVPVRPMKTAPKQKTNNLWIFLVVEGI